MYDLNALSFGAGAQSSALILMAEEGRFGKAPDCAIFADTQGEPEDVYDHLEEIMGMVSIPVHIVSEGDLRRHVLDALQGRAVNQHTGQPPFYAENQEGKAGMLWRKCTTDYKIIPIHKKLRSLLGYKKGEHVKKKVRQWFGISIDEAHRMRDSREGWIDNYYPLVENNITRQDCAKYLQSRNITPRKSACWFCPYTSNHSWARMRRDSPKEFSKAVEFDKQLREFGKMPHCKGDIYLHRRIKPLAIAVDIDDPEDQYSLDFGEECEGMCGV